MKLSWIFGSSMAARHLLYTYVSVWLIQGGYAAWIARNWLLTGKYLRTSKPLTSPGEDS